jgi:hypothetical protein
MIWSFEKKEVNKSPKFKVGDDVSVHSVVATGQFSSSPWSLPRYNGMQGVVLEVANHSIDGWVYQVSIDIEGFEHIQYFEYFGETELDYTLQRKREDKLKELGI